MVGMGTHGLGADVAIQSTAVAKPNVWDTINKVLTNVVQPAANIYTQIKTDQAPGAVQQPGYPQPQWTASNAQPNPQPVPVDNTKKYLLIGGAVVVIGGVIYFITKKKK